MHRPFILAGHSQGSDLLKDFIKAEIEGKEELVRRLVCFYCVGAKAGMDTFSVLQPCSTSTAVNGFVSWAAVDSSMDTAPGADGIIPPTGQNFRACPGTWNRQCACVRVCVCACVRV